MGKYHYDIFVYLYPLPEGSREIVLPCADGAFTVYINDKLDQAGRLDAYRHAVWHIENEDWQKLSVQWIEHTAHGRR